jgi:DUF1680 family protein
MGLEQYAYRIRQTKNGEERKEIAYWRKHSRLHGWFEKEWRLENDDEFICVDMYLTLEMLAELEDDIKNDKLPKTEGFFFGGDSYGQDKKDLEEQKKYDLEFIDKAEQHLKFGDDVVYTCWW